MLKFLRKNGYAIWLGGAVTAFGNLHLDDGGWWAIVVPTIILSVIYKYEKD